MKKVLVVSGLPFSHSNRGIDIITETFSKKGYLVDHLLFTNQFNTKMNLNVHEKTENVNQLFSKKTHLPYLEKIMWFLPNIIMKQIVKINQKSVEGVVDFNSYNIVVIESGKPVFLIDLIPMNTTLIYRQSDSIKYILSKNKYFSQLESKTMERAQLVLVVSQLFYDLLDNELKQKSKIVENGYSDSLDILKENKNECSGKELKKAVYLGYSAIDYHTIEYLAKNINGLIIEIIGNCMRPYEVYKISKIPNVKYYGNLPPTKYLQIIKEADIAIIPYKKRFGLKYIGITSKFYLFMKKKMPIVTYDYAKSKIFKDLPIFTADNIKQFYEATKNALKSGPIDYDIDFDYYSRDGRIKEYSNIIDNLEP